MPNADAAMQLRAVGLRLKALGAAGNAAAAPGLGTGKTLRAQLLGGIRAAVKPSVEATRKAALDILPKAGGLNVYISGEQIKVATRLTGPQVGVRIVAASGQWNSDQSEVRHPVFGRRKAKWAVTKVATPGWFHGTLTRETPKILAPMRAVMESVAVEATRRL